MVLLKLKKLEAILQNVDNFDKPKIQFEQYITPPHIASCFLYNMQTQYNDLESKLVADLGCGCGMLSIGAALLGADFIIGFDLDPEALDIFRLNISQMELNNIDCIQDNVLNLSNNQKWQNIFDTVIMNPPFGTKNNAGLDVKFVETGIQMATNVVYSLHKSSTRKFITKKLSDWQVKGEVIAELKYNLEASYKFHKNKSVDIEVDCWRFNVEYKGI